MIELGKYLICKLVLLGMLFCVAWMAAYSVGDADAAQLSHDVSAQNDFIVDFSTK